MSARARAPSAIGQHTTDWILQYIYTYLFVYLHICVYIEFFMLSYDSDEKTVNASTHVTQPRVDTKAGPFCEFRLKTLGNEKRPNARKG